MPLSRRPLPPPRPGRARARAPGGEGTGVRLGVARLFFAANSFSPIPTPLDAFRAREWAAGPEALERHRGEDTELGAALAFVEDRAGWEAVAFRCVAAPPGGPMEDAAFAAWVEEVEAGLRREEPDGLYLSLHGACATESDPEADLTLLRRLRAALGPNRPLVASFDPGANLSPRAIGLLDGASAGRGDGGAAARRALRLLERALAGRRAQGSLAKLPWLLPGADTAAAPMAELWEQARQLERLPGLLDVSPLTGFAWGDGPGAGPGAMAWAEEHQDARAASRHLAGEIAARRARLAAPPGPAPEEALRRALAAPPGLVALLDPADDPLRGGPADTPGLLRALVEAGPPAETVFCFLHDPAAAAAAREAGVGGAVERALGARLGPAYGAPVPFRGRVEALAAGRFLREGPGGRGEAADFGPAAVLRQGALRVVVASRREAAGAALDPVFLARLGLQLGGVRLLAAKAGAGALLAAFAAPPLAAVVECEAPGPAARDLSSLPFRHVPPAWRGAAAAAP